MGKDWTGLKMGYTSALLDYHGWSFRDGFSWSVCSLDFNHGLLTGLSGGGGYTNTLFVGQVGVVFVCSSFLFLLGGCCSLFRFVSSPNFPIYLFLFFTLSTWCTRTIGI